MANLLSRVTGNWLTASTWGLVDTTSLLISRASNAVVPTSPGSTARSSAFTPGAITIDGIAINIANRTGTTGTLKCVLWNNTLSSEVAATAVTINVADLPAMITVDNNGGWTVFAFSSVLLLVATDYMVQLTTSSATQVSVFANATTNNWARLLRTTTTQAPTTGDDMVVAGELTGAGTSNSYTITMNSTSATDYGSGVADGSSITPALCVSCNGTLTFGTTAATNYILRLSGNLANALTGTINVGTVGTPMPRNSTAVVEFDCAADADFGWHNHGGTCNIQGLSRTSGKNVVFCKLNTDEAVAQTVLGVDTDTGWLSGDQIAIASTTRETANSELRTLSANANAADMTVTAGLTFAHSGTSPTQAEVINLTRNVKIRSVSSTAMTFFHCDETAIVDVDWAEFFYLGEAAVIDWRGITVETMTGSFNMQFCSLHDFEDYGFYADAINMNNMTFSNNVCWNLASVSGVGMLINGSRDTGGSIVVNANIFINQNAAGSAGVVLGNIDIDFTNNTIVSTTVNYAAQYSGGGTFKTFSGNTYHSNSGGASFLGNGQRGTVSGLTVWRNGVSGLTFSGVAAHTIIETSTIFGQASNSIEINTGSIGFIEFRNGTWNADTETTTANAIHFTTIRQTGHVVLDNCNLSTPGGIKTAHTVDIQLVALQLVQLTLRNTILAAATEVANQANLDDIGFVCAQKHDQVAGTHKTWIRYGTLTTDSTIFHDASPSMRMTPISAIGKLESAPLFKGLKVAVNNGGTVTISVYTRKSTAGDGAAYNGAQPRLIVKANPALGTSFNNDAVLDTHTAAAGTWEQLTGTTATVTDAGVLEFVVDCDGTVGFINCDDWSVS